MEKKELSTHNTLYYCFCVQITLILSIFPLDSWAKYNQMARLIQIKCSFFWYVVVTCEAVY